MYCPSNNLYWSYFPCHPHNTEAYPDLPDLEEQSESGSVNAEDYDDDCTATELEKLTNEVNRALCTQCCDQLNETLAIDGCNWDPESRKFFKYPGKGVIASVRAAIKIDELQRKNEKEEAREFQRKAVFENPANLPVEAVLETYLSRQRKNRPDPAALNRNVNRLLQDSYRLMLVDWLVEVALEWSLKKQTLHRAILYVDRFLSVTTEFVLRNTVQLIGCTCLMLACKMEEIKQESARRFQEVTDNTYDVRQILEKELSIVKVLECKFSDVTVVDYLSAYSELFGVSNSFTQWFASLMADICLHSPQIVAEEPARVALAILTLALRTDDIALESRMCSATDPFVPYSQEQIQHTMELIESCCSGYASKTTSDQEQGLKYIILSRLAPQVTLPYPLSHFQGGTGTVVPPV